MQKRSFDLAIHYAPVDLPSALPIKGDELFEQGDKPITYLHWHQCLEIGYCYSGSGIFRVEEKVLPFRAGDISFINSSEVHLAQSAPGTVSRWTWIYLDPIQLMMHSGLDPRVLDSSLLAGARFNNLLSSREHPQIERIVLRLVEELAAQKTGVGSALRPLVWELMILMHRLARGKRRSRKAAPRQHYDRIAPALQFLSTNYRERVNIALLARACRLSVPHFRRLFIHAIGRTPREYWHAMRLRMAASLLQSTSRSVLEISQDVGFETLSSFNRQFRTFFSTSPRTWRARET